MAALPYIQLYVADYLADTAHLNAQQHGAYLLLIFNYWQRGKPLLNINERLANVARMSNEEWLAVRDLLAEFFEVTEKEWIHHRVEIDLEAVKSKSEKAKKAGKASAAKRGNKRSTDAEQTLNHTDTDTDKKQIQKQNIKNNGRFTPPDFVIVKEYCVERNRGVDPQKWFDFYLAKDWMIGKNKMKNWKAAVRTWEQPTGNNGSGESAAEQTRLMLEEKEA